MAGRPDGPYVDKGRMWPDDQGGKGHNVVAPVLPDGRYAMVVSETRPGDVFVADSPDGLWKHLGKIQVDPNGGRASNVAILRPDGRFAMIAREGSIGISEAGILGPYRL